MPDSEQEVGAHPSPVSRAHPTPLLMELELVDIMQVSELNVHAQAWSGHIFLALRIPGGARNADLNQPAENKAFPLDEQGRPTFRPPAGWYLDQIEASNAVHCEIVERRIIERVKLQPAAHVRVCTERACSRADAALVRCPLRVWNAPHRAQPWGAATVLSSFLALTSPLQTSIAIRSPPRGSVELSVALV